MTSRWLILAAALAGCADGPPASVIVRVTNAPPETAALLVQATASRGETTEHLFDDAATLAALLDDGAATFAIALPAEGTEDLAVLVSAVAGDGCVVARATTGCDLDVCGTLLAPLGAMDEPDCGRAPAPEPDAGPDANVGREPDAG